MILKVKTTMSNGAGWLYLEGQGFHAAEDPPLRTYIELLSSGNYVDDHELGEGGNYMTFQDEDLSSDAEGHIAYQEVSFTDYQGRSCRVVFNDSAYLLEGGKTIDRFYGGVLCGSIPIEKEPITGGEDEQEFSKCDACGEPITEDQKNVGHECDLHEGCADHRNSAVNRVPLSGNTGIG
jgi:hypothetical protein